MNLMTFLIELCVAQHSVPSYQQTYITHIASDSVHMGGLPADSAFNDYSIRDLFGHKRQVI